MPVVSEPVSLPHTWRPLGVRIAAGALGAMLTFVVVFAWLSFDAETRASFTFFQVATLVALGVLAFGLGYALARSRVVAGTVRNEAGIGRSADVPAGQLFVAARRIDVAAFARPFPQSIRDFDLDARQRARLAGQTAVRADQRSERADHRSRRPQPHREGDVR